MSATRSSPLRGKREVLEISSWQGSERIRRRRAIEKMKAEAKAREDVEDPQPQ